MSSSSERAWRAGRRRDIAAAIVTMLIAVAIGYTTVQSWHTQHGLQQLVTCQAAVNDELRDAIRAREQAGTDQLTAQLELLTTPPGDPVRGRQALLRYVERIRAALASRQANPFPTRDC